MYKTDVTYTNPFTEETVAETLYFHLTKAELLELEAPESGEPMSKMLTKFEDGEIQASDILSVFKRIVLASYGKRVGDKFIKNDELREEFKNSEAYSEMLMKILQDEKEAVRFISSLLPKDVLKEVNKHMMNEQSNREGTVKMEPSTIQSVVENAIPQNYLGHTSYLK